MTAPTTRETADHADHIGDATTMIDHAELSACPFCGGKAVLRDGMGEFWVCCDDCGASGSMRSRQDCAVRDWNARPREAALLSEIAALRDYGRDVAKEALEYRRQRDEAVGLLRKATGLKCDDWRGFASFKTNARALLANQGADQ